MLKRLLVNKLGEIMQSRSHARRAIMHGGVSVDTWPWGYKQVTSIEHEVVLPVDVKVGDKEYTLKSSSRERAHEHAVLDEMENAPFASVGGIDKLDAMEVEPGLNVAEEDHAEYIAGYQEQAEKMYGPGWRSYGKGEGT